MRPIIIRKSDTDIVDLKTKVIRKYSTGDKSYEVNVMNLNGRYPENPNHFIFETECKFMLYVTKGHGKIYLDEQIIEVEEGDAIEVPTNTKFASEGYNFEYLTVDIPAWFPEQASIVDKEGNEIIDN